MVLKQQKLDKSDEKSGFYAESSTDNRRNSISEIPTIQSSSSVVGRPYPTMQPLKASTIQLQPLEEEEELLQPKLRMQPLEEEEELLQPKLRMQPIEEEEELLQPKANNPAHSNLDTISSGLSKSKNSGSPLPESTGQFMSRALSTDLGGVKVHTDATAIQMNQQLGAKAFTHGNDIYFNKGEYNPSKPAGKRLLAHELTHVVQQNGPDIQRVPMPAEADVSSLSDYAAGTRQRIRYDTGYDLQSLVSQFFQPGIVMDVVEGYNVTYVVRGFPAEEAWLADPLKALALYNFNLNRPETAAEEGEDAAAPPSPVVNISTVQTLNLSGQTNPSDSSVSGPHARIRFTSIQFDASGTGDARIQNVQLVIEKLGNYTPTASTETPEERSQRYSNTYQITNAVPETGDPLAPPNTMSDQQFDQVLRAMNGVPANLLSRVTGIPVYLGLPARGPHGEAAEYEQDRPSGSTAWDRKITVYGQFFSMNAEQQTFTMIHEIGHALDYRPNETAANRRGGAGLSSGTGQGSFRRVVSQDGGLSRGMSTYAATSSDYTEYYAEAFAMYIDQTATLRALRPNVFQYFSTQFPSSP